MERTPFETPRRHPRRDLLRTALLTAFLTAVMTGAILLAASASRADVACVAAPTDCNAGNSDSVRY